MSLNDPAKDVKMNYTENIASSSQKEASISAAIKGMTFCSFSERKVLPWVLLYWITVSDKSLECNVFTH